MMSDKKSEFSNPDCLPVENVTISVNNDGVVRQIKALDPYWVEKRQFVVYEPPPVGKDLVVGAVEDWKSKMEIYLEDLKWLLSLQHHRFWSTILYHPQCMDCLVSFLQEASPPYLPPHESEDVQNVYNDIRRYILVVFCRLITNKESKTEWMTKEYMAGVIYEKFVFTIPILWDICLVYGVDNKPRVSRLVSSVFTVQPQYENDAAVAIAFVNEAFKYIILQVNKDYDSEEPPNLPETFKGFAEINRPTNSKQHETLTFDMLKDLVIHMLDTAMTLRIFIEVHPKIVTVYRKTNLVNSIVQLYEYGIPQLYEKLEELGDQSSVSHSELENQIELARAELTDIFRQILASYKTAIYTGEGSVASHVEQYLAVMMEGLSERLLIRDYSLCYPVHEDLEMLRQAYPDIDPVKTDFILQAVYSNMDEPVPEHLLSTNQECSSGDEGTIDKGNSSAETIAIDDKIPDKLKEESLVTEVKDILPHLGDGFILKCLQHYGFNSERVINSILEDSLDDSLRGLDTSLPTIPEDPLDTKFLETGLDRLNVFDGDEFDIMHRDDVDLSKIHRGKRKSKYKDLKDMLDDKSEIKKHAELYSKYSLVCDEKAMYSDEFDDTLDDSGPEPACDVMPDEVRRPFVTPLALRLREPRELEMESEEDSESDEQQPSSSSKNRLDFCVNPEEIRARREASYQARRGKGHRPPPKSADVVGKPRGQGQEKEVLASRERKEKHKSSRGNHNRRGGAQRKRSQGMVPS